MIRSWTGVFKCAALLAVAFFGAAGGAEAAAPKNATASNAAHLNTPVHDLIIYSTSIVSALSLRAANSRYSRRAADIVA